MKKWLKNMTAIVLMLFFLMGFVPNQRLENGVYDETGYMTEAVVNKVQLYNTQLKNTEKKPQIALLVVKSLNGQPIERVANETARAWKIGFSDTNYGALIVVSINDRKMRIETSDQMATIVTDIETRRILDLARNDFRAEKYDLGVQKIISGLGLKIAEDLNITLSEDMKKDRQRFVNDRSDIFGISIGIISVVFLTIFLVVGSLKRQYRPYNRRTSFEEDVLTALIMSQLFGNSTRHRNGYSNRNSRIFRDDDDDDFFSGFGSGGSSGGWSGGGFSGGGSSSGW